MHITKAIPCYETSSNQQLNEIKTIIKQKDIAQLKDTTLIAIRKE